LSEWDHEIRVVVLWILSASAEVDHFVPCGPQLLDQVILQTEAAVIGCHSSAHSMLQFRIRDDCQAAAHTFSSKISTKRRYRLAFR